MRKQVLAALAMVAVGALFANSAEAQSKSIGLGLRGGLNLSTVSWNPPPPEEINSKTGFHAGLVVALDLHEFFGIEIDGLYTQQGFNSIEPGVDANFNAAYIQVPLMAKGKLPVGSSVAIRIMGGPAVAFEAGCTVSGTQGGVEASFDCDDPLIDADRKKTLWSLMFGGGLGINAGPATVFLDVLYDLGLTNVAVDSPGETVKGRSWMFSAGFTYPVAILQ
jgi:hypothetical protein